MPAAVVWMKHARFELLRMEGSRDRAGPGRVMAFDRVPAPAWRVRPERIYVLTERPNGRSWLVGVLEGPSREGEFWCSEVNATPIADVSWARKSLGPRKDALLSPTLARRYRALVAGRGPLVKKSDVGPMIEDLRPLFARLGATPGPSWTSEELRVFEKTHRFTLPAGYRAYLAEVGDGKAGLEHDEMAALRDASAAPLAKRFALRRPWMTASAAKWLKRQGELDAVSFEHYAIRGKPSDGCLCLGTDYWGQGVWLVLNGAPKQKGTIWLDSTGTDYGGWEPTRKDFLTYVLEEALRLVDAKEQLGVVEARELFAELDPSEELAIYTGDEHVRALVAGEGGIEHALALAARMGNARRGDAADLLQRIAEAARDDGAHRFAIDLFERSLDLDPRPMRSTVWPACSGPRFPDFYALLGGEWERAEKLARRCLEDPQIHPDAHRVHLQLARVALGKSPDPGRPIPDDPTYDFRRIGELEELLAAQPLDRLERMLDALPPELALSLLLVKSDRRLLFLLPRPFERVEALASRVLERVLDGMTDQPGRESRTVNDILWVESGLAYFIAEPPREPEGDERAALGRTALTFSFLICGSLRFWDREHVGRAIARAEALGIRDANWVARFERGLAADELDPALRRSIAEALPRISRAGSHMRRAFHEAVLELSAAQRETLRPIVEATAPDLVGGSWPVEDASDVCPDPRDADAIIGRLGRAEIVARLTREVESSSDARAVVHKVKHWVPFLVYHMLDRAPFEPEAYLRIGHALVARADVQALAAEEPDHLVDGQWLHAGQPMAAFFGELGFTATLYGKTDEALDLARLGLSFPRGRGVTVQRIFQIVEKIAPGKKRTRELLDETAGDYPAVPEAHVERARAYAAIGAKDEAEREHRRAIELGADPAR